MSFVIKYRNNLYNSDVFYNNNIAVSDVKNNIAEWKKLYDASTPQDHKMFTNLLKQIAQYYR
jgi:hypothetical protein